MNFLQLAIQLSLRRDPKCKYFLGAIGVRQDGAIVRSRNGGAANERTYSAHAEARLARKLDWGSEVFVARTRSDGTIALAKPCIRCQNAMRNRGVVQVTYTIGPGEFGVLKL
jgi:tRNA(Arg) A34 adenosine deaminase TadA